MGALACQVSVCLSFLSSPSTAGGGHQSVPRTRGPTFDPARLPPARRGVSTSCLRVSPVLLGAGRLAAGHRPYVPPSCEKPRHPRVASDVLPGLSQNFLSEAGPTTQAYRPGTHGREPVDRPQSGSRPPRCCVRGRVRPSGRIDAIGQEAGSSLIDDRVAAGSGLEVWGPVVWCR